MLVGFGIRLIRQEVGMAERRGLWGWGGEVVRAFGGEAG